MIYFDNSATTLYKPPCVINAVTNTLKYVSANGGRSGHKLAARAAAVVYSARKALAEFVGCDTDKLIFCNNCTDALNTAILGSVIEGGHVITTAYEHNSVLRPLYYLKQQGKISLTVLLPSNLGIVSADMVERAIKYNTYLIAINHVSNVSGATSPISEIARISKKHRIMLLVDGAQSVGYSKIDIKEQGIDMLCFAPHKGLHAPQGVGCLALNQEGLIVPTRFGGTGTSSLELTQPKELPESLESGTLATPAIAGAGAGAKWTEKYFFQNQSTLIDLSMYFWDKVKSKKNITIYSPDNVVNGIFSFGLNGISSVEVSNLLSENYDIYTRSGLHCAPLIHQFFKTQKDGLVRVSLGIENTFSDIDNLFIALDEISRFFE